MIIDRSTFRLSFFRVMDRRRENRTFCVPHDTFSRAATERIQEAMIGQTVGADRFEKKGNN
jgi:hypothetical protein